MAGVLGGAVAHAEAPADVKAGADEASDPGDITVTARKRSERLSDVPLSIKALGSEDLVRKGVHDLQDVADLTPGLRFTDFLTKFNGNPTIRGLGQTNVQNAIGNVGVFADGIYLQRGYMVDSQLGDLERVEVVKGPQSALYGQNTFSGAINYVINKPTNDLKVDLLGSYGNAGYNELRAGIGGPIIKDVLLARVYFARSNYDGTWKNNFPGADSTNFGHFSGYSRQNFTGSLEFRPTDRISIRGTYIDSKRRELTRAFYTIDANLPEDKNTCGAIAANGSPYLWCGNLPTNPDAKRSGKRTDLILPGLFAAPQPGMRSETKIYRVAASYNILDPLTLSYDFGHVRGSAIEETVLGSNSYKTANPAQTMTKQREAGVLTYESHEVKLAYDDGGPFKIDGGVFHSTATDIFLFGLSGVPIGVPQGFSSTDPLAVNAYTGAINSTTNYSTTSGYGRASYALLDGRLTIAAEGRYTHTKLNTTDHLAPTQPPLYASYNDFTPRGSVQFKLTPDMMLYGSVAQGAKAGGFNGYVSGGITLDPEERSFGEEKNITYEVGTKGQAFDRVLTYEVGLFWVDWTNRQIGVPPNKFVYSTSTLQGVGGVPSVYKNQGNARSYGAEISATVQATRELTFNLGFTYQNATITKTFPIFNRYCDNIVCNRSGDNTGNRLPFQPQYQGSLGVNYRRSIGNGLSVFAGADEIYRGQTYMDNINVTSTAAYWLTHARVGVAKGPWQAMFFVKNLFNEKYVDAAFSQPSILQNNVNLGELRTFGATLSFNY